MVDAGCYIHGVITLDPRLLCIFENIHNKKKKKCIAELLQKERLCKGQRITQEPWKWTPQPVFIVGFPLGHFGAGEGGGCEALGLFKMGTLPKATQESLASNRLHS